MLGMAPDTLSERTAGRSWNSPSGRTGFDPMRSHSSVAKSSTWITSSAAQRAKRLRQPQDPRCQRSNSASRARAGRARAVVGYRLPDMRPFRAFSGKVDAGFRRKCDNQDGTRALCGPSDRKAVWRIFRPPEQQGLTLRPDARPSGSGRSDGDQDCDSCGIAADRKARRQRCSAKPIGARAGSLRTAAPASDPRIEVYPRLRVQITVTAAMARGRKPPSGPTVVRSRVAAGSTILLIAVALHAVGGALQAPTWNAFRVAQMVQQLGIELQQTATAALRRPE